MPHLHRGLPQHQAVFGRDQRDPTAVPFSCQRQVIGGRGEGKHRELEATLAELRRMAGTLVATGSTQDRQHVVHKSRPSLCKACADHNRDLFGQLPMPDSQHRITRGSGLDPPLRVNRYDLLTDDLELRFPRHVAEGAGG